MVDRLLAENVLASLQSLGHQGARKRGAANELNNNVNLGVVDYVMEIHSENIHDSIGFRKRRI